MVGMLRCLVFSSGGEVLESIDCFVYFFNDHFYIDCHFDIRFLKILIEFDLSFEKWLYRLGCSFNMSLRILPISFSDKLFRWARAFC